VIKYILSTLLLLVTLTVSAQKRSVVKLISSKNSRLITINGKDVIKVYDGVFTQDYSTMRSDSGYFYADQNAFDAFGNVHITQGDTLNIYSDKLNYNGNTKIAILTDNVKLIDRDATLTTNYLTYNTATRVGTYTGGGKLVNKDNTLTSKNGYYFAYSRDSYFRYNVNLLTADALIKTDTLRYNTGSRIAYFYGPTNIYDTKGKKDTLYTENGLYNTITEQAFFGKKNLYKQGTKTLTGDSLFYDRLKGYGRAVKRVTFKDREQNITLKGQLATYYRATERTVVTQDPYVILVTEEKDTTKTDSVKAKVTIKNNSKTVKKADPLAVKTPPGTMPVKSLSTPPADTTKTGNINPSPQKVKRDSIYISADSLETQMVTFKDYKQMQLKPVRDTSAKVKGAKVAGRKAILEFNPPWQVTDTARVRYAGYFAEMLRQKAEKASKLASGTKKPSASTARPGAGGNPKGDGAAAVDDTDDLNKDPIFYTPPLNLKDTARIRIVKAYHGAKLFKSDLQAKADSMFYSYADSTLRCYVNPMIWAQGSQLSGDTITIQMKNKKLDNLTMYPSSFIVNIENNDSTHFNQIAGKRMKGYFVKDKLDRMFVVGNAESIYFSRDSLKNVDGMQRSISSRMKVHFKENKASTIVFLTKPEHRYGPLAKFTEEDKILKGFIWKPKDRPASKEAILPSYNRKIAAREAKSAPAKPAGTKPGAPGAAGGRTLDSLRNKPPLNNPAGQPKKGSTAQPKTTGSNINNNRDSVAVKVPAAVNTDSTDNTPAPIKNRQQQGTPAPLMPKNVKRDTVVTKQL